MATNPNKSTRSRFTLQRKDLVSSKRASMAQWHGKSTRGNAPVSGEALSNGWTKGLTDYGMPYYLNHDTQQTQWLDPRLQQALSLLSVHNDVKFAAYRAALKIRDVQVFLRLSKLHLSTALNALYTLEAAIPAGEGEIITAEEIYTILLEFYSEMPNPAAHSEILTSWLLHILDRQKTGQVDLQAFKTCVVTMCASWLEEKYRFFFGVYDTDRDGYITQQQMARMLAAILKVPHGVQEAWAFKPTPEGIQEAVYECLHQYEAAQPQKDTMNRISLNAFLKWAMNEPRCLIWLPTMHRVAATENSKHEVHCAICKVFPIVGFRYRNMTLLDCDVCQDCFWTGREDATHKATHEMKEYCFQSSVKQDVEDMASKLKTKLSKAFRRKKTQQRTELTAEAILPEPVPEAIRQEGEVYEALNYFSTNGTRPAIASNSEIDEHEAIRNMAARLHQDDAQAYSTMIVSLDTEQKMHLLRVIDELDSENRELMRQVMEKETPEAAAAETDKVEKDALKAQVSHLDTRNKELLKQLEMLQSMLSTVGPVTALPKLQAPAAPQRSAVEEELDNMTASLGQAFKKGEANRDRDDVKARIVNAGTYMSSSLQDAVDIIDKKPVPTILRPVPDIDDMSREQMFNDIKVTLRNREEQLRNARPKSSVEVSNLEAEIKELRNRLNRLSAKVDEPTTPSFNPLLEEMKNIQLQSLSGKGERPAYAPESKFDWTNMRGFSEERLNLERLSLEKRLSELVLGIERLLSVKLRANSETDLHSLLTSLEDGSILCALVNAKLAKQGMPMISPHVAAGQDKLPPVKAAENHDLFTQSCMKLKLPISIIPSHVDMTSLTEDVASRGTKRETVIHSKVVKIADAVESLLALP